MSEIRDILGDVVDDRQTFTADRVTNLRLGTTFRAEIEEIQDVELNTELGRDPRESVLLHVSDRASGVQINAMDKVSFTLSGVDYVFTIVRRKDNPVSLLMEFGCAKFVPDKDS